MKKLEASALYDAIQNRLRRSPGGGSTVGAICTVFAEAINEVIEANAREQAPTEPHPLEVSAQCPHTTVHQRGWATDARVGKLTPVFVCARCNAYVSQLDPNVGESPIAAAQTTPKNYWR